MRLIYPLLMLFLCACSSTYVNKSVCSADQFVIDSYKIREGKFSILEMEGSTYSPLSSDLFEEYPDLIAEDDLLYIALYHPSRGDLVAAVQAISQQVGFKVEKGKIHLPNLGDVEVIGLTLEEAKHRIRKHYSHQIKDVDLFLSYKYRASRKVELAGLVQLSSIPVDGKLRLFDALASAKVPPQANLFKSYLVRSGEKIAVDFHKLLAEGDMNQNIVLKGGDKIYIAEPNAATLMVMGEVARERVIDLPAGFISLREALALAGGIPFTGDKSYIQVIRGNIAKPRIYTLNWQHVIHLPNDSLLLMPGDIVYVSAKPITEWNRFISQLLPSFTGFELTGKGFSSWGLIVP